MTKRCEAQARKGTGTGMCDRPLDRYDYCDRASDHIDVEAVFPEPLRVTDPETGKPIGLWR